MTGREMIIYILQHNLEDEEIFKDGVFIGFASEEEAAVKLGVGIATVRTGVMLGVIPGFMIGNKAYIIKEETRDRL